MPTARVEAAERPFPKYEMTFEKIEGRKNAAGECENLENPEISHLTHYAFNAMLNQCEGVRTTIRFFYNGPFEEGEEPTLQFRWGATWQYTLVGSDDLILGAVENFLYDGEPVSTDKYDPANPAVLDENGNPKRMGDGTGVYEPAHIVFEDVFAEGLEHTIQFDSFLPANGDSGGLSWGTGSTGDTQGGSIGATANGLWTELPAAMDFRYVLHSEYLAARGFAQDEELEKDLGYDSGLPERKWATANTGIQDTAFELIACLEEDGQQLANVASSKPVNEIYSELPFDTATLFEDKAGSYGFARWPWEWYTYQDGHWDPKSGLRPMNRNHDTGDIDPYYTDDEKFMALPYKPTIKSLELDIPGYEYVDNDITIFEKGEFDLGQPVGSYKYLVAPNVVLRRVNGHATQHFYLTYKKIPGTFELEKQSVSFGQDGSETREALEGAEFKLYQVVDETKSPCGLEPDLTDTEVVEVCAYQEPTTADELEDMMQNPKDCENKRVRPFPLADTDGSFTTDEEGKFRPEGDPSLEPGDYLVREVSAPGEHLIVNEWIPFTVPLQIEGDTDPVTVYVENYMKPTPPPSESPSESPSVSTPPETPGKPELPVTGVNVLLVGGIAVALFTAGLLLTLVRRRS